IAIALWLRGEAARARGLGAGLVLGSLAASFYLLPYAMKAASLGGTRSLRDIQIYSLRVLLPQARWPFIALSVAGLAMAWRRRREPALYLVLVAGGTLAALYVLCGPVYHAFNDPFVAFTPSRFTSDLVYLLALFAGYGFTTLTLRL